MRNFIFITILSVVVTSCQNVDKTILLEQIESLTIENKALKDSLAKKYEYTNLISSELILLPNSLSFNLNDENRVTGVFTQRQKLPHYELYLADEDFNFEKTDKLNFQIREDNKFEFNFVPKRKEDKAVRVVAVFDLDTVTVKLFGRIDLPVK